MPPYSTPEWNILRRMGRGGGGEAETRRHYVQKRATTSSFAALDCRLPVIDIMGNERRLSKRSISQGWCGRARAFVEIR